MYRSRSGNSFLRAFQSGICSSLEPPSPRPSPLRGEGGGFVGLAVLYCLETSARRAGRLVSMQRPHAGAVSSYTGRSCTPGRLLIHLTERALFQGEPNDLRDESSLTS